MRKHVKDLYFSDNNRARRVSMMRLKKDLKMMKMRLQYPKVSMKLFAVCKLREIIYHTKIKNKMYQWM